MIPLPRVSSLVGVFAWTVASLTSFCICAITSPQVHVAFSDLAEQFFLTAPPIGKDPDSPFASRRFIAKAEQRRLVADAGLARELPPHGHFSSSSRRQQDDGDGMAPENSKSSSNNNNNMDGVLRRFEFQKCGDFGHGATISSDKDDDYQPYFSARAGEDLVSAQEAGDALIDFDGLAQAAAPGTAFLSCGDAQSLIDSEDRKHCCAVGGSADEPVAFSKHPRHRWTGLADDEYMYVEYEVMGSSQQFSERVRQSWSAGIVMAGSRFPEYYKNKKKRIESSLAEVPHRSWFIKGNGEWEVVGIPLKTSSRFAGAPWGSKGAQKFIRFGQRGDTVGILIAQGKEEGELVAKFGVKKAYENVHPEVLVLPLSGLQKLMPPNDVPDFKGVAREGYLTIDGSSFDYDAATFGTELPTDAPLRFELQSVSPSNGCEPLQTKLNGRAAYIVRGGCEFLDKVLNAQDAGASFVIVGNREHDASSGLPDDDDDESLLRMDDGPRKEESLRVTISSSFVSRKAARKIKLAFKTKKILKGKIRDHLFEPGHHGPHILDAGISPFLKFPRGSQVIARTKPKDDGFALLRKLREATTPELGKCKSVESAPFTVPEKRIVVKALTCRVPPGANTY